MYLNIDNQSQYIYIYISCAGGHFYGTENDIWAGFGQAGNTENEIEGLI